MTNSWNLAIPAPTYVPVTMYATTPWQVNILSLSFPYASHIHDEVSLSSPLKGIERKILQQLPVSEMLYSGDLTFITLQLFQSLNFTFLGWTPQLATVIQFVLIGAPPGPIGTKFGARMHINLGMDIRAKQI